MSTEPALEVAVEKPTFDSLPLTAEVQRALSDLRYTHPTPVQLEVYRPAAAGKDLVVQARTGTGKTTAFGLPMIDRLVDRARKGVQSLVLCPTRELALQVTRELGSLAKYTGLSVLPVYGGAPMNRQVEGLRDGAQILVGTPGRVLDHLRRGNLDASAIRLLALDECDEMLSMGFLPQIMEIWQQLPKQLQVLLFSATVPRAVMRVADSQLRQPEFITLSGDSVGALEIEHYAYLSRGDKIRELLSVLELEKPESAIIFCNTRDDTLKVAAALKRAGYTADWLNADLAQKDRESVMQATREGKLPFLVCTDVAARGIDISHLTHVINFDFPESTEQYVHRTGRTGRAGRTGTAISLVSPASIGNLYYLRLEYKIHPIERQLPSEAELAARSESATLAGLVERLPPGRASDVHLAKRLFTHDQAEALIASLLRVALTASANTVGANTVGAKTSGADTSRKPTPSASDSTPAPAIASDSEAPPRAARVASRSKTSEPRSDRTRRRTRTEGAQRTEEGITYHVAPMASEAMAETGDAGTVRGSESPGSASEEPQEPSADPHAWGGDVEEIFINVGRDDRVRTADLQAALVAAGITPENTAYVKIKQRHSFVGVRPGTAEEAIKSLSGQQILGKELTAELARPREVRGTKRRDIELVP